MCILHNNPEKTIRKSARGFQTLDFAENQCQNSIMCGCIGVRLILFYPSSSYVPYYNFYIWAKGIGTLVHSFMLMYLSL